MSHHCWHGGALRGSCSSAWCRLRSGKSAAIGMLLAECPAGPAVIAPRPRVAPIIAASLAVRMAALGGPTAPAAVEGCSRASRWSAPIVPAQRAGAGTLVTGATLLRADGSTAGAGARVDAFGRCWRTEASTQGDGVFVALADGLGPLPSILSRRPNGAARAYAGVLPLGCGLGRAAGPATPASPPRRYTPVMAGEAPAVRAAPCRFAPAPLPPSGVSAPA